MKIARQTDLFQTSKAFKPNRISHGGELSRGKRKLIRPLDRKKKIHVIFKSSHAQGRYSFLTARNRLWVYEIVRRTAVKFGIKIHMYENVGNHLHLAISFGNREGVQNFLRTVPALVARFVTGARRGKPFGKKFWDSLVFTRVVSGRRDFMNLIRYFQKNQIERDHGGGVRKAIEDFDQAERKRRRKPGTPTSPCQTEWANRWRSERVLLSEL